MRKARRIKDRKPPLEIVISRKGRVYYNAYKKKKQELKQKCYENIQTTGKN